MHLPRITQVGCAMLLAVAAACSPEQSPPPGPAVISSRPMTTGGSCDWPGSWFTGTYSTEDEEEIFGKITGDQTQVWGVALAARNDGVTAGNQPSYRSPSVPVNFASSCETGGHKNAGTAHWGWYGYGPAYQQCRSLTNASANDPERHRDQGGAFPQEYESHCANGGRFLLTIDKADQLLVSRPVDYIAYSSHGLIDAAQHLVGRAETPGVPPGNGTADVIVDFNDGASGAAAQGVVDVTATPAPDDTTWFPLALQGGAYHAPSNFWVRFGAGRSVPVAGVSIVRVLVRYFWNWGVDTTRSGFVNAAEGVGTDPIALVRVRQFPTGSRTVRAHIVQPFERPATPGDETATTYGAVVDLPLSIYTALTASVSQTPTGAVEVGTPVQFSDIGQNGSGGNQYQWQFGAGEGTYAYPSGASVSYSFVSTGVKTVTLSKRDSYGFTVVGTATVNVVPPPAVTIHAMYSPQNATVRPNQSCSYRADVTGGVGTPTYAWYQNGVSAGSTRVVDISVGAATFPLKVVVYTVGDSATTTKTVGVSGTGILCP